MRISTSWNPLSQLHQVSSLCISSEFFILVHWSDSASRSLRIGKPKPSQPTMLFSTPLSELSPWLLVYHFTNTLGFINTFLLKPKKMGENRKLWISWNHIKLLVSLIVFLPTYKFIPILSEEIVNARFFWLFVMIFVSPAARFYREYFTKKN